MSEATTAAQSITSPGGRGRLGIWALAAANAVSQTGNSMTALAVPWFVLITTGSASRTGLAGAVVAFSPIVAGMISGPIVDRVGFRRTSIISDLLSGVTVAIIPVLYWLDWLTFWQLLVLIFLGAFFDVPGYTARSALVPALARMIRMPLERANSVMQLSFSLSDAVVAPLLAGVLIAAIGAANVLLVDAGTFGVSILIVGLLIALPRASVSMDSDETDPRSEGMVEEFLAGFRFVIRDRVVGVILPVAILTNFLGRAYFGVLLPVYVRDEFDNPAYLGLIIAAMGVGTLGGTVLYAAYGARFGRYRTFLWSFAFGAAAIWLFTIPVHLATDLTAMLLFGLAFAPLNPMLATLVQTRTPERMLGRALSAIFTLFTVAAPLGVLAAGFAVDAAGLRAIMLLAAGILTAVPLWIGLSPWSRAAAPAFDER